MACTLEGELVGSISGGCVEEDFLEQLRDGKLRALYENKSKPMTVIYGETEAEQARLKLPCGGQLHVLLEFLEPSDLNKGVFDEIHSALERHSTISRVVDLTSGEVSVGDYASKDALIIEQETMIHSLSPMYKLLLLGAGDVAKYLAEIAIALEYHVTLCDPRPNYLDNWNVHGVETSSRLPDDIVRESYNNPYSGIIALAHDPRVDDMALMEALKTDAFYVGAMGSERTSAARRERLPELGLTKDEIDILHAPIGFEIGSKTPAEIAVSIMAEITAIRHDIKSI